MSPTSGVTARRDRNRRRRACCGHDWIKSAHTHNKAAGREGRGGRTRPASSPFFFAFFLGKPSNQLGGDDIYISPCLLQPSFPHHHAPRGESLQKSSGRVTSRGRYPWGGEQLREGGRGGGGGGLLRKGLPAELRKGSGWSSLEFGVWCLEFGVWCWSSGLGLEFGVRGLGSLFRGVLQLMPGAHASSGPDIHFSCLPALHGWIQLMRSHDKLSFTLEGGASPPRRILSYRVGEVWEGIFAATPCFFPDGKVISRESEVADAFHEFT